MCYDQPNLNCLILNFKKYVNTNKNLWWGFAQVKILVLSQNNLVFYTLYSRLYFQNEVLESFGCWVFYRWCHKDRFRHFQPKLSGSGHQCQEPSFSFKLTNTLTPRLIQVVREKTAGLHVALHRNISGLVSVTDLVEVSKDLASLAVCTRKKKFFGWGMQFFCEWRHKWRTFRPPWPTSPGAGPKPLDGSISLKFSLETKLQSKSFDTMDDLLGFWVQKLWSKLIKIFD